MLRICEKLREVDNKSKRLGLARTETDYLRALLEAMVDMDRLLEVEVLKSLGDVNLEKGKLHKDVLKIDRAMMLYRTSLLRCENEEVRESLKHRYKYADKLRLGKGPTAFVGCDPHTDDKKTSSVAQVVRKFLHLDRTVDCNKDSVVIEYTKLMIEGIVNKDSVLEVEAIKSLGDVYLKRGTESKDTTYLTKATALYNSALHAVLARRDWFQGTDALVHRLLYTAKIRHQLKRAGNKPRPAASVLAKVPRKTRQQVPQGHVSRDFPAMSLNPVVGEDVGGQRFLSYDEYLSAGDGALTKGNLDLAELNFASALKLIHDRNKPDLCKESKCLCRLGDVYAQRGKRTKEGRSFTQAAALYNAAIARTDKKKHKMLKGLQDTERSFLHYTANVRVKPSPPDLAVRHQKRIDDMRTRAKSQLEAIDQQHNPYQYDEDDPMMRTVEAERAEAVKYLFKTITKDRQCFIQDLVDEGIETLGPPPCKYAFIGLGSQATELVTPYSDLEFAILIEDGNDNDDTRRYFINLTHYVHLKVINLGETILPAMAIPSLNDFQSEDPEKDWFFDSVTPRGFAFDGFMPWASKTPFGRDQTKTKPPVSLIQTPAKMAEFQEFEISLAEGYHLSDILRRFAFLAGDEALVSQYMTKLNEITEYNLSHFKSRLSAMQILWENREQFSSYEPTGQLLNVKKDIYRFPGIAIELVALCCQINLASTWDVVRKLKETDQIQEEEATHLMVLTSISAELRLRTYMGNRAQKDNLSPLAEIKHQPKVDKMSDSTLQLVFHIPDTKVLFRYYCRAIPLKKCLPDIVNNSVQVQSGKVFKTTIFDTSNECRGRIAKNLLLTDKAVRHLEAALQDAGDDAVKRSGILYELGQLGHFADVTKAKCYIEESIMIRKSLYGDSTAHPDIASSLAVLSSLWSGIDDQKKAIRYQEQALMMRKIVYRKDKVHPEIATSLHNLGACWSEVGDQKKAISYFEQSVVMMKTILGDKTAHTVIAKALDNLGLCWSKLGDKNKAVSYYEKSLTIWKTAYGHNTAHPDIAASLHYLGSIWSELGDRSRAIYYSEQSLAMTKTIYGDTTAQPQVATSLDNLGLCWGKLGDLKKAISCHEHALAMRKAVYGDNTSNAGIAVSLHNLGSSYSKYGDEQKAISYTRQSLTMTKRINGDTSLHPSIAKSLSDMGTCLNTFDYHEKAISYFEQSLSILTSIHGDNTEHLDIALVLKNLGLSWSELNDQKKAIRYYEQSLAMTRLICGDSETHPEIAGLLESLGSCWRKIGDQKKAISYIEKSLCMRKTIYGEYTAHRDILLSLHSLGLSWGRLGVLKKAVSYYEQSLAMAKVIYGDNTAHSDIAMSLNSLGASWTKLRDHRKAIGYYEQSLTMLKIMYGNNSAHPDIVMVRNNLRLSRSKLGHRKKASY